MQGNCESLAWVVERLSPLLRAQARFRLERSLGDLYDPDDLVQEVWAVMLSKWGTIEERGPRMTPVLLGYASGVLLNLYGALLKKHLQGKPSVRPIAEKESLYSRLADDTRGVVSRVVCNEERSAVEVAIDGLSDQDREIVILRAIEQLPNNLVAAQLEIEPNTAAARFRRALERLRQRVAGSVFDELGAD